MTKDELRDEIYKKAIDLSKEYKERASMSIATRLMLYPFFQQVQSIFIYVSMENEPDTKVIIDTALSMGKKVYVPRVLDNEKMEAVEIKSRDELLPGHFGILEPPVDFPTCPAYKIEMAIIPAVSVTKKGVRLGHGNGYYDRFLKAQSMYKFCLCFEELINQDIISDENDVRMDRVITEDKIYNCRIEGEIDREKQKFSLSDTIKSIVAIFKK